VNLPTGSEQVGIQSCGVSGTDVLLLVIPKIWPRNSQFALQSQKGSPDASHQTSTCRLPTQRATLATQTGSLNTGNPTTLEDFKAGDQNREVQQRPTDLLKALNASPGDWVADVGAGAGYYSMRLSTIVGP
jgi:hypothetical protein